MGMYKSPIETLIADIQHQIAVQQDEEIYKAVVSVGINVDKEELLRALHYDREQYEKGYADGKVDAMAELVRCRDCKHWLEIEDTCGGGYCNHTCWFIANAEPPIVNHSDFCSYGERREGE